MTQISGGGAPSFQIGSRPARKYAQYAQNNNNSNWADALSQIGGAFIERHQKQKRREAEEARAAKQAAQRTAWSKQIGEGATVREIAQRDPSIINDGDYLGFLTQNKPQAEAETFSTVHDPYGRGGVAQQSSVSGQYSGYQGPPAAEGPANTMVDKAGFHRYLGGDMHGQRVFPDVTAPADEPEIDSSILAYEQAQARGHIDPGTTFEDYKNFGRTTNTFHTPPPVPERGYRNIFDDQGRFASQELIPGSGAERKLAAAQEKQEAAARTTERRGDLVSQHAQGIRESMESAVLPVTGIFSMTQDIPGTAGHDISKRIDTLQAIAGFDQLNEMRQQSPTGGALGQVSERELKFLQSVIGSLELSQSKPQFLENLARVESTFNRIVHGGVAPQPQPQPQPPEPRNASTPLARALVGGGPTAASLGGAPQAPQGQAPQAPGVVNGGDNHRIAMYATMPKDALKRQVAQMAQKLATNPGAYSQAEIIAAKVAYDKAFPDE